MVNMSQPSDSIFFDNQSSLRRSLSLAGSICLHVLLLLLIVYFIKQNPIKTVTADRKEQESVKVTLNPPNDKKKEQANEQGSAQKSQKSKVLSQKDQILTTEHQNAPAVPSLPKESQKKQTVTDSHDGLEKFLPKSNPEYFERYRQEAQKNPKDITGDGGDIPFLENTERRRDLPLVVDRFEHKDLSLLQFSQMFHERFSAVWNSTERWVPPESPLKPGDVVYYKIYINPNGTLDHIENLTHKIRPNLNTDHLDKIFNDVMSQTLPMTLPSKLEKNVQVTEVLAIQVVNKTLFMNFGGR